MTKLDFNKPLLDVQGTASKQTLASTLSQYIGTQTKGQTLKLYGWHKALQVGDPLELDDADVETLKKIIDESEDLFMFVRWQLLDVINQPQIKLQKNKIK